MSSGVRIEDGTIRTGLGSALFLLILGAIIERAVKDLTLPGGSYMPMTEAFYRQPALTWSYALGNFALFFFYAVLGVQLLYVRHHPGPGVNTHTFETMKGLRRKLLWMGAVNVLMVGVSHLLAAVCVWNGIYWWKVYTLLIGTAAAGCIVLVVHSNIDHLAGLATVGDLQQRLADMRGLLDSMKLELSESEIAAQQDLDRYKARLAAQTRVDGAITDLRGPGRR